MDLDSRLAEARAAHGQRRYADAYRALTELRAQASLPDDDVGLLADAAWWLGRVSECLSLAEELHGRYLAEGRVDRAALQALDLCGTYFLRGEYAIGSGWLSRARRLLADQPRGRGHAMILFTEVSGALEALDLAAAAAMARDLQALGRELGDDTWVAVGLLHEGLAEIHAGRLRQGFELLDEAMLPVLADRVGPEWAGNVYCTIMDVCEQLGDLTRARQWTAATEQWLTAFADAVMFNGVCRAHRVHLLAVDGDWDRAEAEARQVAVELAQMNNDAIAAAEYERGETHRLRGDGEQAAAAYALAAARGRDPQPGAAFLELGRGRTGEAWAAITGATAAADKPFAQARLLRAQVEIGLAAGHVDAARAAYERLRRISGTWPSPGFLAWADEAEGALLLGEGNASGAVGKLGAAAEAFHRVRASYDAGCAELRLATAYAATGATGEARIHAEAAAGLFRGLGVDPPTWLAEGPRPGGLTDREAEVLQRVAGGATNRAVADVLVISEATVRRHLANVFRKLDVTSRTAAAAWWHENGRG